MAKQQNGAQRDELKAKTTPDHVPFKEAPEPGSTIGPNDRVREYKRDKDGQLDSVEDVTDQYVKESAKTITKPELDRLANRTVNADKYTVIDLDKAVAEVKAENDALVAQKEGRIKHGSRVIRELRENDPAGKRTCGYCGHRVSVDKMDRAKELCEICSS